MPLMTQLHPSSLPLTIPPFPNRQVAPPTTVPSAVRKRPRSARRPPPIAIPQQPETSTSLPTSFYSHATPGQENHVGVWYGDPKSGAASRKGPRRRCNEDRVFAKPNISLYGVCDGHGADSSVPVTSSASQKVTEVLPRLIEQGVPMKDAFLRTDRVVCSMFDSPSFVGTTVTVVQIKRGRILHVAHVGDSRAMLIDADGNAATLIEDHNPSRPDEAARIERNGGAVINGRVNKVLAVSRAVGDTALKKVVPAIPDQLEYALAHNDQLVVVATDGLWDRVSASEVASFIQSLPLAPGSKAVPADLEKAAEGLVEKAIARGSRDDTSVVLIDVRAPLRTTLDRDEVSKPSYVEN